MPPHRSKTSSVKQSSSKRGSHETARSTVSGRQTTARKLFAAIAGKLGDPNSEFSPECIATGSAIVTVRAMYRARPPDELTGGMVFVQSSFDRDTQCELTGICAKEMSSVNSGIPINRGSRGAADAENDALWIRIQEKMPAVYPVASISLPRSVSIAVLPSFADVPLSQITADMLSVTGYASTQSDSQDGIGIPAVDEVDAASYIDHNEVGS